MLETLLHGHPLDFAAAKTVLCRGPMRRGVQTRCGAVRKRPSILKLAPFEGCLALRWRTMVASWRQLVAACSLSLDLHQGNSIPPSRNYSHDMAIPTGDRRGSFPVKFGAFFMPTHPPERTICDGQIWDLDDLKRLDALRVEEAWIVEHLTTNWEPCPASDLPIAQALTTTKRFCLGPLCISFPF